MGRPSKYPLEFRREAAQLVPSSDRSMAEIARELGVHHKTLGNWVSDERRRRARAADPTAVNEAERDELRRLRKDGLSYRTIHDFDRRADGHHHNPVEWIRRIEIAADHAATHRRFV